MPATVITVCSPLKALSHITLPTDQTLRLACGLFLAPQRLSPRSSWYGPWRSASARSRIPSAPSSGHVRRNIPCGIHGVAAPATHRQLPLAVHHIQGAPMPTRWCEVEARCQGHLHHGALTLPAAQMHSSMTREPVEIVHDLDAHADPGVTYGSQKVFSAMIMGTVGCLTAPTGPVVELMQK